MVTRLNVHFPIGRWFFFITLLLVALALNAYGLYAAFTSTYTGAADFYPIWWGARALTVEGRNLYDPAVTQETQMALFGHLMLPHEDQARFAYPLYLIFFFYPLTFISYPAAQAVWMSMLQFMLLGSVILCVKLVRWQPPFWLMAFTIFWSMFFYPAARALLLGQVAILAFAATTVALWAFSQRLDRLAGISLAVATVKPHLIFLLAPLLLLYGISQKRWSFVVSFGLSMLVLTGLAMLWIPDWPLNFYRGLFAYAGYHSHSGSPIANLLNEIMPNYTVYLELPVALGLLLFMFWSWLASWRSKFGNFWWTVAITLIVSNLAVFRSATSNQVMLFLPIFILFYRLNMAGVRPWLIAVVQTGLALFLWTLFVLTKGNDFEAAFLDAVLPTLLLVVYLLDRQGLQKATRSIEKASGTTLKSSPADFSRPGLLNESLKAEK